MTTPPPDTKVRSETLEQVAERISNLCPTRSDENARTRREIFIEVLSGLRNEREACAKLLDERVVEISSYQTRPYRVARRELEAAARAIREGR